MERWPGEQAAVRQLGWTWNAAMAALPVAAAAALAAVELAGIRFAEAPWTFPPTVLWSVTGALSVAAITAGWAIGRAMLTPVALAAKAATEESGSAQSTSPAEQARARIIPGMFIQVQVLDLPAAFLLGYGLYVSEPAPLFAAIVHNLVASVLTRPDFAALVRDTASALSEH